jgi:hypothetical protein
MTVPVSILHVCLQGHILDYCESLSRRLHVNLKHLTILCDRGHDELIKDDYLLEELGSLVSTRPYLVCWLVYDATWTLARAASYADETVGELLRHDVNRGVVFLKEMHSTFEWADAEDWPELGEFLAVV